MPKYVVRFSRMYSTVIEAETEEQAIALADKADFQLDEITEFEADLEDAS